MGSNPFRLFEKKFHDPFIIDRFINSLKEGARFTSQTNLSKALLKYLFNNGVMGAGFGLIGVKA